MCVCVCGLGLEFELARQYVLREYTSTGAGGGVDIEPRALSFSLIMN